MPILGHVLLEFKDGVCCLTASDLEVEVSYSYMSDVSEEVFITVPARKFSDILKSLETEDITLEITTKDIVIKSGKSRFKVSALNPNDFPKIDDNPSESMKIDSEALLRLINCTSFSMGYQDARHFLNGLHLCSEGGKIVSVCTDGHRLAKYRSQADGDDSLSIIIPRKAILEINRIASDTQWNDMNVLDGTFTSKSFQIGNEALQKVDVTVTEVSAAKIGAYEINGFGLFDFLTSASCGISPDFIPLSTALDILLVRGSTDLDVFVVTVTGVVPLLFGFTTRFF